MRWWLLDGIEPFHRDLARRGRRQDFSRVQLVLLGPGRRSKQGQSPGRPQGVYQIGEV